MATLQQKLAKQAYEDVCNDVKSQTQPFPQKYGTMAHKLPILVRTAGLAQALAYVESRGEAAHNTLLNHIAAAIGVEGINNGSQLAIKSRDCELDQYIFLTHRVMTALVWYKRFVESVLHIDQRLAADEIPATSQGEQNEPMPS